jgi:polysaccharide pyruvyl transferase WcaK-like protein
MKIGILTYHSVYNFGANLQVYSTVGYLKNNGFEPVIINWVPEDLEERYNRTIPKVQIEAHKNFIEKNLPLTEICRTDNDLANVISKHNIKGIITGSDAVLQHVHFLSRIHLSKKGIILRKKPAVDVLFPNPFWGSFIPLLVEKIPVVIMSASSQNANFRLFRGRLRKRMSNSLKQFKSITARDEWTKNMIMYLTYNLIVPEITPDPVFAYNQNILEQYSKEDLARKFSLPEKYILISFRNRKCVNMEWLSSFQTMAENHNLSCIVLPMPDGIKFDHPIKNVIDIPLSPEEWYGIIKYSSGYIGENMHPVVVALHNSIPFYAFDSYGIVRFKYFVNEKSSKVYDILSKAGFPEKRIGILGRGYRPPQPGAVFKELIDFDLQKCESFSISQQKKYNAMMDNIISLIKVRG